MTDVSFKVAFYIERAVKVADERMPALMADIATTFANEVKELMRDSPATGRVYRRRGVTHRASAPGEPPAPDQGTLVRSVRWGVRKTASAWFAMVGSTLKYALYLEFGAARGVLGPSGRVEKVQWILYPRPAWWPALLITRSKIPGLVTKHARGRR